VRGAKKKQGFVSTNLSGAGGKKSKVLFVFRSLLGWSNYFCLRTRRSALRSVDRYVYERVRDFLARRHKVAGRGTHRFSCEVVYGGLGLLRLKRLPLTVPLWASLSQSESRMPEIVR
jgi:group II intron maturase